MPTVVVVMGVAGSGKSTVGVLLAERLALPILEADDLHPAANRAKMAEGRPLDDEDRRPWLMSLADWIKEATDSGRGGVVACSALKQSYRDLFLRAGDGVWFLHLALDPRVAEQRVAQRAGHFMPARLEVPVRRSRAPAARRAGVEGERRRHPAGLVSKVSIESALGLLKLLTHDHTLESRARAAEAMQVGAILDSRPPA
ncbi:gluconokinase [Streptomyces sp. NPDC058463]|uniref:gluconokinase n=1 Tax=Streptomyces sp. NPDC058463 TaxID=3346510 RepID=UPI00364764DE